MIRLPRHVAFWLIVQLIGCSFCFLRNVTADAENQSESFWEEKVVQQIPHEEIRREKKSEGSISNEHFEELIQSQEQRRRHLQKACRKKDQRTFYYKADLQMDVAGGNPKCSNKELKDIAKILTDEYNVMVRVDPRLAVVFNLDLTKICNLQPKQKGKRRLNHVASLMDETTTPLLDASWEDMDEEVLYQDISLQQVHHHGRNLGFMWYSVSHWDGWSKKYQFDWAGTGECKWCPQHLNNRDTGRFLRGSDNITTSADAFDMDKLKEYQDLFDLYNVDDSDSDDVYDEKDEDVVYHFYNETTGEIMSDTGASSTNATSTAKHRELQETGVKIHNFFVYKSGVTPPKKLARVTDYGIVDLKRVGRQISLVVATSSDVKSVDIDFDRDLHYKVETSPPFALAGDHPQSGELNRANDMSKIGTHSCTAHPFPEKNRQGKMGQSHTVSFLVIDSSNYEGEPDNDPELINILEEDLSFGLSYAINRRFYKKKGHCLQYHMVYVHVDLKSIRTDKPHKC